MTNQTTFVNYECHKYLNLTFPLNLFLFGCWFLSEETHSNEENRDFKESEGG